MPSPPSSCALASKASCRRSSPRTRFTTRASWLGRWVRAEGCSYACRAGATRTWIQSMVAETAPRLEAAVRATGDLKLIAYMMAGHPTKKKSIEVGKRLATSGSAALEIGATIANEGVPVVLMTYINPILAHDPRRFAAAAAQAGVAGVIIPDLPVEESEPVAGWLRAASLDTIFMVAPT